MTAATLSHHAGDDPARMIDGDAGVESVYKVRPPRPNPHPRLPGTAGADLHGACN